MKYMYILHREAARPLRAIATLIVMALVLWTLGITPFQNRADAANLTYVSDTLSDSDLGVNSNHTIGFTTPTGLVDGETIVITFPITAGEFTLPSAGFDFNDLDVTVGGVEITLGTSPSGDTWGVSTTTSTITLTTSSTTLGAATVGSSTAVVVEIGNNATAGATGNSFIVNPTSAGSRQIEIVSTNDSGTAMVAIIDDVVVTANIDATFTFTIEGVATTSTVNGSPTTTAASSTATSIPFGTLVSGTTTMMAQDLRVSTNATHGFVVTVEQSDNLKSSTGADIDGFYDGTYLNTPGSWQTPSNQVGVESTYGHWGLTSEDDLNTDEFGADLWVAASTTPRQVFENSGPADGTTANVGYTRVGYQVEITDLQEAGDDYTTTLTYIATPTF